MIIVHLIQLCNFTTFGNFATAFYKYVCKNFEDPNVFRIHVIFDRYDDISLKNVENIQKTKNIISPEFKILNADTKIPKNSKTFLTNSKCKLELVNFLCCEAFNYVSLTDKQQLIISGGFPHIDRCYKFVGKTVFEIEDLRSNHLEADTRILSHALYDCKSESDIYIHSVDTDVFILAVYLWEIFQDKKCNGLYFCVKTKNSRVLHCHKAASFLTTSITRLLPALHAFTGCGSTSKIGTKTKALNLVMNNKMHAQALYSLGCGQRLSLDEFRPLEKFYLDLLGRKESSADEARQHILSSSLGGGINLSKIPCTSDALYQHALRASVQTYIWRHAALSSYEQLDFKMFGYKFEKGALLPVLMTKVAIPGDLLRPCNCSKTCKTKQCSCKKNGKRCIPLCKCDWKFCENKSTD